MQLSSLTAPELIFPQLTCQDRTGLMRTLSRRIIERGYLSDADELYDSLVEREGLGSTGVGFGVAIPHCKMDGLEQVVMAVALLKKGIDFGAPDGAPVRLFFLVISPSHSPAAHLQCLAAISRWVKVEDHVGGLLKLADPQAIFDQLADDSPT